MKGEAYEVAKRAKVKNCMVADWVLEMVVVLVVVVKRL